MNFEVLSPELTGDCRKTHIDIHKYAWTPIQSLSLSRSTITLKNPQPHTKMYTFNVQNACKQTFCRNGDGLLNFDEFKRGLRDLGVKLPDAELVSIWKEASSGDCAGKPAGKTAGRPTLPLTGAMGIDSRFLSLT